VTQSVNDSLNPMTMYSNTARHLLLNLGYGARVDGYGGVVSRSAALDFRPGHDG
jgi:hypothetical protein